MIQPAIILFGKFPREGFVKTRLAASIGDTKATEFYRRCLCHYFSEALEVKGATLYFCFADKADEAAMRTLTPATMSLFPQIDGPLPDRITAAFTYVFQRNHSGAVIFSTDAPGMTRSLFSAALTGLTVRDTVIGRDSDHGYYAFGMRTFTPQLLEVHYDTLTRSMYQQTVELIKNHHLTVHLLPQLFDVDTINDLEDFRTHNPAVWNKNFADLEIF